MTTKSLLVAALAALQTALLAACGGGGGAEPAPPADGRVPAHAGTSARTFASYLATLAARDDGEPLTLEGFVPPTSETDEPIAVE